MTNKDKEAVQRMLGLIEGVAFGADEKFAAPIHHAVKIIGEIVDREEAE